MADHNSDEDRWVIVPDDQGGFDAYDVTSKSAVDVFVDLYGPG